MKSSALPHKTLQVALRRTLFWYVVVACFQCVQDSYIIYERVSSEGAIPQHPAPFSLPAIAPNKVSTYSPTSDHRVDPCRLQRTEYSVYSNVRHRPTAYASACLKYS